MTEQIFSKASRKEKIEFMNAFYTRMIEKSKKKENIKSFKKTLKEINNYEENEENTSKLISIYQNIEVAKNETKKDETKKRIANMQKNLAKMKKVQMTENKESCDDDLDNMLSSI